MPGIAAPKKASAPGMYNYTEIIYRGYDDFNLAWPAFNSNVSRSSGPLDIHIGLQ